MYKILFDDNFYINFTKNEKYMKEFRDFIIERTNFNFVFFHPFAENNIKSFHLSYRQVNFEKYILNKRRGKKYDLNQVTEISDPTFTELNFSKIFIGKMFYLKNLIPEINEIILLYENAYKKDRKHDKDFIFYINHYAKELNSNIKFWIEHDLIHISFPDKNTIFPARDICCYGFEELRSHVLKSFQGDNDKMSKFEDIGTEVAYRNHYHYDNRLTQLNKRKAKKDKRGNEPKRKIFVSDCGETYYLSIDFENGGFEVFDKKAKYLGQYRFNCCLEKMSDPKNHVLYLN